MKALLVFMAEVFGKFRWLLVRDTLLVVVEGALGTIAIVSVVPVVDAFLAADPERASVLTNQMAGVMRRLSIPTTLGGFLAVLLALQLIKSGFAIFVRHRLLWTRHTVVRNLLMDTFEDCFRTRWTFFSQTQHGTILNIFLREMSVVWGAVGAMTLLLASVVQVGCYLVVPFYISWQVTSISLAVALLLTVPFHLFGKVNYRLGKQSSAITNELTALFQQGLGMAKTILGFGNYHKSVRELNRLYDAQGRITCRFMALQAATPLMYEPWGVLVLVVTAFAGRHFGISLSEGAMLLWALRNCIPLLGEVTVQKNTLMNFVPSYEQIRQLRARAREFRQPSGPRPFRGFQREIAIERLSFAYPGRPQALHEVTLVVPKGQMVALVGESGSGKTTLVDVVMGLLPPTSGQVTIDGTPLGEFDIDSYRSRIGYVPQESVLFNATIRENLRWAHELATDAEIEEACRQAHADEFIERFPERYETVVGDRGVRLSGGQCQRIALARAILRKPELLMLDEATSSLDTHSERLIQEATEKVAKDTTVIVIAHRLSTIVNADRIYVLERGRIVEEGTRDELVERGKVFSRMMRMQHLHTVEAVSR